jgi:hypothetical protein
MDIKMLDVFMVTRLSYRVLVAALAACSLFVVACEKVPLLAPTGSTITLTASTTPSRKWGNAADRPDYRSGRDAAA